MVLLSSCSTKDVEKFDINPIMNKAYMSATASPEPVRIDLCESVPFNWDALIIIPPYSELDVIDNENLENTRALEKLMPGLTGDEGYCLLLFIENKTIVKYSLAPRANLDFNGLVGQERVMANLSRESVCKRLVVKKSNQRYFPSI